MTPWVQTSLGLARFVVIADNAWTSAQQSWLEKTLSAADKQASCTIVTRHHPAGDTSVATNPQIMQVVRAHKFALFLAGHTHHYAHPSTDGGRDVVIGTGGAPLADGGTFYGHALVEQRSDGWLRVSVYDATDGTLKDRFSVGPNP